MPLDPPTNIILNMPENFFELINLGERYFFSGSARAISCLAPFLKITIPP
jgi:hypothetical protein